MASVSFRVSHSPLPALAKYASAKQRGIGPIMTRSEQRLAEAIQAHTPVRTGHMKANLLKTSDVAPVGEEYQVFWRPQEFIGVINPFGEIIRAFYPSVLILGGPERAATHPDLMVREAEEEGPQLVRDLTAFLTKVA